MYASVGKAAILETDVATSQAFYNMIFENNSTRDVVFQILKKMEATKMAGITLFQEERNQI